MTNIQITMLESFQKEFEKLSKKWRSLPVDFSIFLKTLKTNPRQHVRISELWDTVEWDFYKVKKFRCSSIARASTKSWIRIIYRYIESTETIELSEITFVELYHKNEKENHDSERIKKHFPK
jgi:mRNA-degrading endonuclease RelE of RelBE toxin-antitoxin system